MESLETLPEPRRVLLAFGSFTDKALVKEILSQLDARIVVDFAPTEHHLLTFYSWHRLKHLPGLIVFDDPPVRPDIGSLVDSLRASREWGHIPIVIFLDAGEIPSMSQWLRGAGIHFFPRPAKPSEWKYYLKQTLSRYGVQTSLSSASF
jgi:hypothetical protein